MCAFKISDVQTFFNTNTFQMPPFDTNTNFLKSCLLAIKTHLFESLSYVDLVKVHNGISFLNVMTCKIEHRLNIR